MTQIPYITTSWDDGHPLDLRVATMLAKHGLPGTFYVPQTAERATMTPSEIRELSGTFEIGAHTIQHVDLTRATEPLATREIVESKSWVEEITGAPCRMFCPPKGRYTPRHLETMRQAGYAGVRSVELLSLSLPRRTTGPLLMPTTVQAHPHRLTSYAKNMIKRAAFGNLCLFLAYARTTDWVRLAQALATISLRRGGVFHLWGHSWEVDQYSQWQQLEEVLRFLGQFTSQAALRTNGRVCQPGANGVAIDS